MQNLAVALQRRVRLRSRGFCWGFCGGRR
jgi:hypothetical protein